MTERRFAALIGGLVLSLAVVVLAGAAPARAQTHFKAGILECEAGTGIGLIITSSEGIACTFKPNQGRPETYSGRIRKFGLDVGVTEASAIVWAVFAAQSGYVPGSLAGKYIGISAEASVALGVGANALIGGSNRSIALQPVSVQAQEGLNLAVGVTELELTSD